MSCPDNPVPSFAYRAWAMCAITKTRELFERHFYRMVKEAPTYHINRVELHDYYIPWVNFGITYRDYPKMQEFGQIPAHRVQSLDQSTEESRAYMKQIFQHVKNAGLKVNLWYHVGRDVPPGLAEAYPEYTDVDTGFVYQFEENCLDEFFDRYPEVDAITVTSLHETDSVLGRPGKMSRKERLLALYNAIYRACRKHNREFVLRDFIVKKEDFDDFAAILDQLPRDIIIMTKEVLADWSFVREEMNPFIPKYSNRRLVIEMDTYGEYYGRSDIPYCDPAYYYKCIRQFLPFGIEGATGRIVHDGPRQSQFGTIFDSLNEINAVTFANTLYDVGPTMDSLGRWAGTMLSDPGHRLWQAWTQKRFGKDAAPYVVAILRHTPEMIQATTSTCDFGGQMKRDVYGPEVWTRRTATPSVHPQGVLHDWVRREPSALAMIQAEKDDLVTLSANLRDRARALAAQFKHPGLADLVKGMENLDMVARASRVTALIHALGLIDKSNSRLPELAEESIQLADQIASHRGETFHFELPRKLREWAGWAQGPT